MGSEAIGAIGLGLLLVLMILRVPVALTMLIVGVVGFAQIISWDAAVAQLKTVRAWPVSYLIRPASYVGAGRVAWPSQLWAPAVYSPLFPALHWRRRAP